MLPTVLFSAPRIWTVQDRRQQVCRTQKLLPRKQKRALQVTVHGNPQKAGGIHPAVQCDSQVTLKTLLTCIGNITKIGFGLPQES